MRFFESGIFHDHLGVHHDFSAFNTQHASFVVVLRWIQCRIHSWIHADNVCIEVVVVICSVSSVLSQQRRRFVISQSTLFQTTPLGGSSSCCRIISLVNHFFHHLHIFFN